MKRIGVVLILLLAFFGLADSLYLAQHELSGTPLLCNIQNLSGCNVVVSSQYSYLFGIPLAELGVLFYGVLFVLAALEIIIFHQFLRRVLQVFALIGVLSSLYFTAVQVFLIGAVCVYCLASSFTALLILIFASLIEPIRKRTSKTSAPPPIPLSMPPVA
ncbi:MAG: vitamin K epoxide reductase family protein [Patescibacteria group bacterium]|nr:vitamin K epoxide reductase family protein [Patescibacteria group bacterium]